MSRRATVAPVDLIAVATLTVVTATAALLDAPPWLLAAPGLSLVLLLPGYAILAVTHPASGPSARAPDDTPGEHLPLRRMAMADRLLLSVPLSVAAATIVGLVLNFLPVGVTRLSVLLVLASSTLLAVGFAFTTRFVATPPEDRPAFAWPAARSRRWHEWTSLAALGVAVVVLTVAAIDFVGAVDERGYVALFVEPNQRIECYPLEYGNGSYSFRQDGCGGDAGNLTAVVNNHAPDAVAYRLSILWSQVPGPEDRSPDDILVQEELGKLPSLGEPPAPGAGADATPLQRQLQVPLEQGPPPYPGLQYLKVQLFVGHEAEPSHALQLRVEAS